MSATPIERHQAPADGGAGAPVRRRIALLNVKYSPNLGDGLLSECLENELGRALPDCTVVSVDLAGRTAYPLAHGGARGAAMAILERCPPKIRRLAAWTMLQLLVSVRLRRHYRAGLAHADAVVVGGGNLFSDADLNFPIKIAAALDVAARKRLPVAVYAVGVSSTWSKAGTRLFAAALARCRLIRSAVRDRRSQDSWARHFAGHTIPPASIVVDPGVLASVWYPSARQDKPSPLIGFCVTDPLAVRYHSDPASAATLDAWYPSALRALVEQGFEVALFTNGSPEDREYLHAHFHEWIRKAKGPVRLARSFTTPRDLAALVSDCDAVVGHRMHACIAAHSFGVPAIGLRWDEKLDSFFELAGRKAHMLDPSVTPAATLGRRTAEAIAQGADPAPLIAEARAQITAFAAELRGACKPARA